MRNVSAFQPNGIKQFQLSDTSLFSDANLVSYWKFEGNSNDSKGSNDGTDTAITYGNAYGKFGQGANFIRTSNSQILTSLTGESGTIFTYTTWFKTSTAQQQTIGLHNGGVNAQCHFYIDSTGRIVVHTWNGTTVSAVLTTITYQDGNWHSLRVVKNGSAISIYVDNDTVVTGTGNNTTLTTQFCIGRDNLNNTTSFDGDLDDVAVFSKALTAGEIQQLYFAGTTKAYYPLNGNSRDFSGNTNTGTDTTITYPQGRFGQGAKFNGTTSKISSFATSISPVGSRTIIAWIKPSTTTRMGICATRSLSGTDGFSFLININPNEINYFHTGGSLLSVASQIKINQWQQIAVTYDVSSTTTSLYVNGYKVGTNTSFSTETTSTYTGTIGQDKDATGFFNGIIDEVIIESRVWTAKEVETYYRKSMLNYKKGFWANLLKAFSITDTLSLTETSTNLRARNFTSTDTLSLTEVITALKGIAFTVSDTLHLTEVFTSTRTFVFSVLDTLGLTDLSNFIFKWNKQSKGTSTWTDSTKPSTTFTSKTKGTSTWTKKSK